jgi:hypothetical protein
MPRQNISPISPNQAKNINSPKALRKLARELAEYAGAFRKFYPEQRRQAADFERFSRQVLLLVGEDR